MTDYKVNFKDLKAKVGIDDVAYALGYRLDRKAGVGRYMELVLGDGKEKRDALVICHPQDKASQRFFRRDGSKGDVVTLIRENLNAFNVSGKDEWQKIAKVLSRFANMPEPEYREDREYVQSVRYHATFDSSRYEVKPINPDKIPAIFQQRGLSDETVRTFAPFIRLIRDRKNENFDGYNIGFPYTNGENDKVRGYEMRGYGGYKSKAAGSDSSSSAWVADLSGGYPNVVKSVFFCESAFDVMAFYQWNRKQLTNEIALVSLGGTFSDGQIRQVLNRFPGARPFDCFDNDLPGRIYGLRMMALVENIPLKINRTRDSLEVEANGRSFGLIRSDPFRCRSRNTCRSDTIWDNGFLPRHSRTGTTVCSTNRWRCGCIRPNRTKSITWPNAEMQALNYKRMNVRRWKRSLLIAAVGLLIGKTPLFAQQTDPALTSAVLGQTAALKKIHKDRKKTQEKIIAAEVAVTASLERIHQVEDKMLDYLSNAQGAMQNLYQIKRAGELVAKEIPQNCSLLLKSVGGNLKGTVIAAMVSDELTDAATQMTALFPFMKQLVTSGKYDVTGDDGKNEKHKVNLLNASERYYIANEVVSCLEAINTDLFILAWQVRTLSWNDLWFSLDPEGWANVMSGKNIIGGIISDWNQGYSLKW